MAEQEQFKRHVAFKFRIGDLLIGKPILDGERFSFLDLGDKKIVRVNIIGNIIEKYDSEGEKKYSFITIDDGSGQIKLKTFGDDIERLGNLNQGQTVVVIGVIRFFNNEIYVSPEIIKESDSKYLLVRKLEIEKERKKSLGSSGVPLQKDQIFAIKDQILDKIKNSEENGGIEIDHIILSPELRSTSPEIINQEIKKLLEEGIIFEPRPGKIRYLG